VVRQLAERAGLDSGPIDAPRLGDRRAELLNDFFVLCQRELAGPCATRASAYLLAERGFPPGSIQASGLGLVPPSRRTTEAPRALGYTGEEIGRAISADSRWPGRIPGAWRDDRGRVRPLWARSVDRRRDTDSRYLYLRGAPRTSLPPYGLSTLIAGPRAE